MENQPVVNTQEPLQLNQSSIEQNAVTKQKTHFFSILITALVSAFIFGLGGFYLNSIFEEAPKETISTLSKSEVQEKKQAPSSEPVIENHDSDCNATYSSQYLKLSFRYDSCTWELSEDLLTPEEGLYSRIWAKNKNTGHRLQIKAQTLGMGGGYPGCYKTYNIQMLNNNIVRLQMEDTNYHYYLTEKNDYAIKGQPGAFGDEKFQEYFDFLNPEAFPNTNMCWRGSGINTVEITNPETGAESYRNNKDIVIAIEDATSNKEMLSMADTLVQEIYTNISAGN